MGATQKMPWAENRPLLLACWLSICRATAETFYVDPHSVLLVLVPQQGTPIDDSSTGGGVPKCPLYRASPCVSFAFEACM